MLLTDKAALVAKRETVYAIDSTPTGPLNAMQTRNLRFRPIVTARENRDLFTPFLGNSKDIITAAWGEFSFDIELAGAGALGGIPPYDPLLRSCGMAMVNEVGVRTVYKPISAAFESATMAAFFDGVLIKILGARGNVSALYDYRQAPKASFRFMGIYTQPSDTAFQTFDFSNWVDPVAVSHEHTDSVTCHGVDNPVMKSARWDLGNKLNFRNLVNDLGARITGRAPTAAISLGAELMAVKNWFEVVKTNAVGSVGFAHGKVAGNALYNYLPAAGVVDVGYSDFEGSALVDLTLRPDPTTAGNDEIQLVVR